MHEDDHTAGAAVPGARSEQLDAFRVATPTLGKVDFRWVGNAAGILQAGKRRLEGDGD